MSTTSSKAINRAEVLENLAVLRQEWEVAADGSCLIDVTTSVGLLLFDITNLLGLTKDEQRFVLGNHLCERVARITLKGMASK